MCRPSSYNTMFYVLRLGPQRSALNYFLNQLPRGYCFFFAKVVKGRPPTPENVPPYNSSLKEYSVNYYLYDIGVYTSGTVSRIRKQ